MTLPNFFIIGSGRSGTTSIHRYLGQHPDVYVSPVKEPQFYGHREFWESLEPRRRRRRTRRIFDRDCYLALFDGVTTERAIGESSVDYLRLPSAAREIRDEIPHARLLVVLRNPVDRAYRSFLGARREGAERAHDFWTTIHDETSRRGIPVSESFYLAPGFFAAHLTAYHALFPPEQLLTLLFEDFRRDPAATMRTIFTFLDVDPAFAVDTSVRHNPTGVIRNPIVRALWACSHGARARIGPLFPPSARDALGRVAFRTLERPALDPRARAKLIEIYRDDVTELQGMVGRDLSHWLEAIE